MSTIGNEALRLLNISNSAIEFPNVTTIGRYAFSNAFLKSITFGPKLDSLAYDLRLDIATNSITFQAKEFKNLNGCELIISAEKVVIPKVQSNMNVIVNVMKNSNEKTVYDFSDYKVSISNSNGNSKCVVWGTKINLQNFSYPCESVIFDETVKRIENAIKITNYAKTIEIKGAERITKSSLGSGFNLKEIKLPKTLTRLNANEPPMTAFNGSVNISIEKGGKYYIRDKMIMTNEGRVLIAVIGERSDFIIPSTVREIRPYALRWIGDRENMTIPGNVRRICDNSLCNVKNLTLEEGVEELGKISSSILSIKIPDSLKKIKGPGLGIIFANNRVNYSEKCKAFKTVDRVI